MYFTFAIEQASPRYMLVEDALVASECLVGGFTQTDAALGGKWLSLLKEAVPGLTACGVDVQS
jgi:hypothetical protein